MKPTTLSVKYKPIKIGFLVQEENIDDLIKVAGMSTLLWGGIYNPIIPVSKTKGDFQNQLINLFSVDVLFAVSKTKEINKVINDNPYLRNLENYNNEFFYEDFYTKKNIPFYLDSINIVDYYWEKEFKNKEKDFKSNFALVKWEHNDNCKNLFSLFFGYFPTSYNLKDDFQNAFINGLKSQEITIIQDGSINKDLAQKISPIIMTSLELDRYGGKWHGNGLYIGSENDFIDLLYFWNLRAAGLTLWFLPIDHIDRFENFIREYIKYLDEIPNSNPNINDDIVIYFRYNNNNIKTIVKDFQGNKRFVFSHCDDVIWNNLNIKPASFYFDEHQLLANVDKKYENFNLSLILPEKKFINDLRNNSSTGFQSLAVSIDPIVEFSYPNHTLRPPFIRELNEFYSREIAHDPWKVRSEINGIGLMIEAHDTSLSLYPIQHDKLIERIFDLAGFKTKMSQAGLLAKTIIHSMREDFPLEACRVFKITGVRKLIKSLKEGQSIKLSQATKIIWDDNFCKFKLLFIESRDKRKLNTTDVFKFLVKKKIFTPKLNLKYQILRTKKKFKCRNCGLKETIKISNYLTNWACSFCGNVHYMPWYIIEDFQNNTDKYWKFVRSGLFTKDNNQEGAIPIILSLLVFARILHGQNNFIFSTSLYLKNSIKCEIDFCVLQYERGNNIQFGIAECKSKGQKINQQDVNHLKLIQDEMNKLKIDCYIIFSKTTDTYEREEIEFFESLKNENRKFIILSNKELEPYEPYWEMEEIDKLPKKYVFDMDGMYRNSLFLYLGGR